MSGQGELPPGWAWTTLGELITGIEAGKNVAAEGRPPGDGETGIVKVSAVTWGEFDEEESKTLFPGTEYDQANLIQPGDFLMSRANTVELVGAPVIVKACRRRLVLSDKVLRLRFVHDVDRWVELYLKSPAGRDQIEGLATGAQLSMRNIAQENIKRIQVPMPPDAERARLLKAADDALAKVEAGEAALLRAREGMVSFRASLLYAAVTGQLTADWRASNAPSEDGRDLLRRIRAERRAQWESAEAERLSGKGKLPSGDAWKARYAEPLAPATDELPQLPPGWVWASVDQLTDFRGNGLSRAPQGDEGDFPILRISAVRPMQVDLRQRKFYRPRSSEDLEGATARDGDLLFTRYSGSEQYVGIAGRLRTGGPILYPDKLMCARPIAGVSDLGAYLELAVAAGQSRAYLARNIRTTAGQKGIAGSAVRACPVPLPPANEMRRIVSICATQLEQIAADVGSWADTSADLRQSILHAAFTGKLVPQDPADEPAKSLLARLRSVPAPAPRARRRSLEPASA